MPHHAVDAYLQQTPSDDTTRRFTFPGTLGSLHRRTLGRNSIPVLLCASLAICAPWGLACAFLTAAARPSRLVPFFPPLSRVGGGLHAGVDIQSALSGVIIPACGQSLPEPVVSCMWADLALSALVAPL